MQHFEVLRRAPFIYIFPHQFDIAGIILREGVTPSPHCILPTALFISHTAYHLTAKNNNFWRFHLHKKDVCIHAYMHMYNHSCKR